MHCELHRVSQGRCSRKAAVVRVTGKGFRIHLCKACDDKHGAIVGTVETPALREALR